MQTDILILCILVSGWMVVTIVWCVMFELWKRETRDLLDEVHRCNDEFAEATALFKYGAFDEAIETASRWRDRAADQQHVPSEHS